MSTRELSKTILSQNLRREKCQVVLIDFGVYTQTNINLKYCTVKVSFSLQHIKKYNIYIQYLYKEFFIRDIVKIF